jgi:hypothetical protein
MATRPGIEVEGLRELNLALSRIDPQLRKNLNKRLRKIAGAVRDDVRRAMPRGKTGKARASIRSDVGVNGAYVVEGKTQTPYVPWLDFGGVLKPTGKRKGTQSRPIVKGGRYLYPTVVAAQPRTQREATEAFEETRRELGLHG